MHPILRLIAVLAPSALAAGCHCSSQDAAGAPDPVVPAAETEARQGRSNLMDAEWSGIVRGETDLILLLTSRPIQAEIGLTDTQAARLDAWLRANRETLDAAYLKMANADIPTFEPASVVRSYERISSVNAERAAGLSGILDPGQLDRLRGLALQNADFEAFLRPEVVQAIGLKPGQFDAIVAAVALKQERDAQLIAANGIGRVAVPQAAPGEPLEWKAYREKVEDAERQYVAHEEECQRKVQSTLTTAQKAAFANLLGPPYDFTRYRNSDPDAMSASTEIPSVALPVRPG